MLILFRSPATNVSPRLPDSLSGARPKAVHFLLFQWHRPVHSLLTPAWVGGGFLTPVPLLPSGCPGNTDPPHPSRETSQNKTGSFLSASGLSLPPHRLSQTRSVYRTPKTARRARNDPESPAQPERPRLISPLPPPALVSGAALPTAALPPHAFLLWLTCASWSPQAVTCTDLSPELPSPGPAFRVLGARLPRSLLSQRSLEPGPVRSPLL